MTNALTNYIGSEVIRNKYINKYVFGLSITQLVFKELLFSIGLNPKIIAIILLFC